MSYEFEPLNYRDVIEARALGWGGWDGWSEARLRYLPLLGYAVRRDGRDLVGIGCIAWIGDQSTGHAIGCFSITEEYRQDPRSRWVHRRALEVLALAHEVTPVVYAHLDQEIPNARAFIERLGFREIEGDWIHGVGDSSSQGGGLIHHGELGLAGDGGDERPRRHSQR